MIGRTYWARRSAAAALAALAMAALPACRQPVSSGATASQDGPKKKAPAYAPLDLAGRPSLAGYPDFKLVCARGSLSLYIDPATAEVAVADSRSGDRWFSNPPDRAAVETIAQGEGLAALGSQFQITYFKKQPGTALDNPTVLMKEFTANNNSESVQLGQYRLLALENGVRLEFTVGKAWEADDNLPRIIARDRFERLILDRIADPEERRRIEEQYQPVAVVRETPKNRMAIPGVDWRRLLPGYAIVPLGRDYQALADETAQAGAGPERELALQRLNSARSTLVLDFCRMIQNNKPGTPGLAQLSEDTFAPFLGKTVYYQKASPRFMRVAMAEIIRRAGYTPWDVQADCRQFGLVAPRPNPGVFVIPIEYTLADECLSVRIPCREIKYPRHVSIEGLGEKGERVTFPLNSLNLLPYFGAAGPAEQGYILIPDGSGALIDLNNQKPSCGEYVAPVYGDDPAVAPRLAQSLAKRRVLMPVFGLKRGEGAFLAIIDQGASLARIRAEVSGRNNTYNSVSAEFTTMPVTTIGFGAIKKGETVISTEEQGAATVFQDRIYQGDIRVLYTFLHGREADYVGMAKRYREYLQRKLGLTRVAPAADAPFFLKLIGAVPVRRPILGVTRNVLTPLTTITQARRIVAELAARGVKNVRVEFAGLFSGGVEPDRPAEARLAGEAGSGRDLARLAGLLRENGSTLYPRLEPLAINPRARGFNKNADAARFLNHLPARIFAYNLATGQAEPDTGRYLLSPGRLSALFDSFLPSYKALGCRGISLGRLNEALCSDFAEDSARMLDREESSALIAAQCRRLSLAGCEIMLEEGPQYLLPFTRYVSGAPQDSNGENIADASVPFYQIALHGLVNLAGEPFNLADDYRDSLLRSIEYGTYPYYVWFYQESSAVKNSRYTDLYACHYGDWLAEAAAFYAEYDRNFGDLQDKIIEDHRALAPNVYQTTYENGRAVIVNYNSRAVRLGGLCVKGRSYLVIREDLPR